MKKAVLEKFIQLYYLNGSVVDTVKWITENGETQTRFATSDKTAMGTITGKDLSLPDNSEMILCETPTLLVGLAPMPAEIDLAVSNQLKITGKNDFNIDLSINLGDPVSYKEPAKLKSTPDFDFTIDLTADLVSMIISAKNCIKDTKSVTFAKENDKLKMIFGYIRDITTNRMTIDIPATFLTDTAIDFAAFSSDTFKNILTANKDFTKGIISVCITGLMKINFEHDGVNSEYYLLKLKHV
jgi:hypothetical protein